MDRSNSSSLPTVAGSSNNRLTATDRSNPMGHNSPTDNNSPTATGLSSPMVMARNLRHSHGNPTASSSAAPIRWA